MGAALGGWVLLWEAGDKACVLGVQQRPLRYMSGRVLRRRMRLCGLDAWVQPEHSARLQSLSACQISGFITLAIDQQGLAN